MKQVVTIIFFDGHCGLCSGTVATLIRLDRKRKFKYSSLQGEYAGQILQSRVGIGSSVIVMSEDQFYEKAEAVIEILLKLGGFFKFFGEALKLFPLRILNNAYDFVATHRYQVFGRIEHCLIPKADVKDLFIQ